MFSSFPLVDRLSVAAGGGLFLGGGVPVVFGFVGAGVGFVLAGTAVFVAGVGVGFAVVFVFVGAGVCVLVFTFAFGFLELDCVLTFEGLLTGTLTI